MKINSDTIIHDDNPLLRQKSVEVSLPLTIEDKQILASLIEYVQKSRDPQIAQEENLRAAVGLAAPQIGVLKRLIAVVVDEVVNEDTIQTHQYALANPKIIAHSEKKCMLENGEGCLSVDRVVEGYVPRYARIRVKGFDLLQNKMVEIKAREYLSVVIQHEIDHLDGVLFYDRIDQKEPWKKDEKDLLID